MTEPFFSFACILLILLGLLSAGTTALEVALLRLRPELRRNLRRDHPPSAKLLENWEEKNPWAADCLALSKGTWTALLLVGILFLRQAFPGPHLLAGWESLLGAFFVVIVFCEILPRRWARSRTLATLRFALPLLGWSVGLSRPWVETGRRWWSRLGQSWIPQTKDRKMMLEEVRQDFLGLLELAEDDGVLDAGEERALREIVQLGQAEATHLMTPRVESFLLPANLSEDEARAALRRQRKHWVPVFGSSRDEILGLLNVEDYFLHPGPSYTERLLSPSFVPESMNALRLLSGFLSRRQKMALLLDEYGGLEGLVTLSDVMEEVFGIEGPGLGSGIYLENIGPDRFLAGGHVRLDDLCEALHTPPPDSDAETIAGWLAAQHGTIPRVGAVLHFGPWQITVRRASRKRIKEILVEPRAVPPQKEVS